MVTSFKQAEAIQQRRVAAGKRGYAHAVRRYLKRDLDIGSVYENFGAWSEAQEDDYTVYVVRQMSLPVIWSEKK